MFRQQPGLERISLARNSIQRLRERSFSGLNNLLVLNISGNSLTQLPVNVFTTRNLQILDLSYNDLANIRADTFVSLDRLQALNISSNSLRELRADIFNGLSTLIWLSVDDNSIESLQADVFANMRFLERLDLSGNKLRTFSGDVFGSSTIPLRRLFLRNNQLESIDANAFARTPNLDTLAISHNSMVTLPDNLLAGVRLRKLHMNHNLIDEITATFFGSLNYAEEIWLDHNRFTFIPQAGGDFSNLKRLTIEGNPWQCACFNDFLTTLTARKIAYRRPESRYFRGTRPVCVVTDQQCLKDINEARALGLADIYEAADHEDANAVQNTNRV